LALVGSRDSTPDALKSDAVSGRRSEPGWDLNRHLITGGDIWNGTDFVKQDILIAGDLIEAVAPRVLVPPDTTRFDASDTFVIPGLCNAHTHASSALDHWKA
jgi:imidazolonepropionase-like amidohydrolase